MTSLSQGIKRKPSLLQLADELVNVAKACRIHGFPLRHLLRGAFYLSIAEIQRDLEAFMSFYNFEPSHQGYHLTGRTPAQALREALGMETLPSLRFETIDSRRPRRSKLNQRRSKSNLQTPRLQRRPGDRVSGCTGLVRNGAASASRSSSRVS